LTLKTTNAFRYPSGARPLLLAETARRRSQEQRVVALLEESGFAEIILPILDYAEPYAAVASADASRRSYRFTDREGELVALRCDFTPMAARALAPALDPASLPLRIFYRGDVVRCEPIRLGAGSERFQIGAEIVGEGGADADITVLTLAATLARALGYDPLVAYGDTAIASAFDDEARLALATKRTDRALSPLVRKLVGGFATLDDVTSLGEAHTARLRAIGAALEGDPAFELQLDDIDRDLGYYTGLRFRVLDRRTRLLLAEGGRYDALYARFGFDAPAVGFTFTLTDIQGREVVA
jgi:ATP phosphoribosyltransferase regulatory subunit